MPPGEQNHGFSFGFSLPFEKRRFRENIGSKAILVLNLGHLGRPRAPQERPRPAQDRPRADQDRPRAGQDRPKSGQEPAKRGHDRSWIDINIDLEKYCSTCRPKIAPRPPKTPKVAPRPPRTPPRAPQEQPKTPQDRFRRLPRQPQDSPRAP